jgi:hypothetical protein
MSADDLPAAGHALITTALRGFGLADPTEARLLAARGV